MKKTVLRYGLFSAAALIGMFLIGFAIFSPKENFAAQEVMGYTSMVIAMLFVFFGIRHYRDSVNGGMLSFGRGMKVGLLIVLIPSIIFGLFDVLYVVALDPEFMDRYYNHQLTQMQQTMTAPEFDVARSRMEEQKAMFANPAFQFIIMSLTVFLIGIIATVISSLVLKRARG